MRVLIIDLIPRATVRTTELSEGADPSLKQVMSEHSVFIYCTFLLTKFFVIIPGGGREEYFLVLAL